MELVNGNEWATNVPLVNRYIEKRGLSDADIYCFFQIEHVLVLPRANENAPLGSTVFNGQRYQVRIRSLEYVDKADLVFEYSTANVASILSCNLYNKYANKIVYAPPLPFDYEKRFVGERSMDLLTTFTLVQRSERRERLMQRLTSKFGSAYRNITNRSKLPELKKMYDDTKILINIRQNTGYWSIEEFRVLPALSRGVIVISEDVPLRDHLPYHEHVVWCSYENMMNVVSDVYKNYSNYFSLLYNDKLIDRLISVEKSFTNTMDVSVKTLLRSK